MDIDLLISGGTVLDGTGKKPFFADLLIVNGRIADIGHFEAQPGWPQLDAKGLTVTPGFIDVHSHSDFTLNIDPRAVSSITQGVTTEIVGNCGHGCAPIGDPETAKINIYGYHSQYPIDWRTVGEYLEALEARKPAVNVATLVPNGNLRLASVGLSDRPANRDQTRAMRMLLEEGLEQGAFGFSTGLEYGTERGATEEEITELCRGVAQVGGVYATHTRNNFGHPTETIEEAVRTGEAAGVPVQVSHIGIVARMSHQPRLAVEEAVAAVDRARARGVNVGFDMHTRAYGITNLSAVLPPYVADGGMTALERRLRDPAIRKQMKEYPNIVVDEAQGRWDKIVLFQSQAHPELSGRSIAQIAEEQGVEPLDAIYNILLGDLPTIHELLIIELIYDESDLRLPFDHPNCMVGSDATALATDGPLADRCFHGSYTWASWFLHHFVQEKKTLAAEEAVRRLTSLPAETFGIKDRGAIRKGAYADIAIFNLQQFRERGTVYEPNQIAQGMVHVIVNGKIILQDGRITGQRSGRVLRRSD
jgi:N-acyl-D-amino-acid deacylase